MIIFRGTLTILYKPTIVCLVLRLIVAFFVKIDKEEALHADVARSLRWLFNEFCHLACLLPFKLAPTAVATFQASEKAFDIKYAASNRRPNASKSQSTLLWMNRSGRRVFRRPLIQ